MNNDLKPLLESVDVVSGYHQKPVLKGVSLPFYPGEFVAILGPNGAGKSTLLKVLLGSLSPQQGEVRLDGKALASWDAKARARRMAYIPQDFTLQFDYTVRDFVLMGRITYLKWWAAYSAQDAEICEAVMDELDLHQYADTLISQLSGGERQRVSIARALAQQTDIILMDEAFANLDINHQIELMQILYRIHKSRRKCIVMISHNINLAAEFCQRIIMLRDGSVLADGTPDDVIQTRNLRALYDTPLTILPHPTSGRPVVIYPEMPHE